jgi:hypothetical protein
MKLATSTVLAAALLAGSVFVNAQSQTANSYNDRTQPQSIASPAMNEAGGGFSAMVGTPAAADSHLRQQDKSGVQREQKQMAPDDPRKNPYWEPKDWHYIISNGGG